MSFLPWTKTCKIEIRQFRGASQNTPYSDSAHIELLRNNGAVDFYWDSVNMTNGFNTDPLGRIDLVFGYDPYDGSLDGKPDAYFGRESIDMISVTGNLISDVTQPVPEPSTILLLGTGLAGLLGFGREKLFKK